MTINFRGLTDRQKTIVETIRMRLTEKQAMIYLNDAGFSIAVATYYREKNRIEKLKLQRLYLIAKFGFQDQHLERIDKCEMIEKLMWENYRNEISPFKRTLILREIVRMQPYLSAYYEATGEVIKESEFRKRDDVSNFENWVEPIKIQSHCETDSNN
jgi:hypothetical protein